VNSDQHVELRWHSNAHTCLLCPNCFFLHFVSCHTFILSIQNQYNSCSL